MLVLSSFLSWRYSSSSAQAGKLPELECMVTLHCCLSEDAQHTCHMRRRCCSRVTSPLTALGLAAPCCAHAPGGVPQAAGPRCSRCVESLELRVGQEAQPCLSISHHRLQSFSLNIALVYVVTTWGHGARQALAGPSASEFAETSVTSEPAAVKQPEAAAKAVKSEPKSEVRLPEVLAGDAIGLLYLTSTLL